MIRLSTSPGELLADTPTLAVHVGGAESNVAAAVAHMGHSARWLSRLTDNVWGRRIVHDLTMQGVDCSGVVWTPDDRIGMYAIEFGVLPRSTRVVYDRANSAPSRMGTATFDLSQIGQARLIHLTGITAALSDDCYALVSAIIDKANQSRVPVVFDVNYRAKLWSAQKCAERLSPLLRGVDTLIIARADAAAVFGVDGTLQEVANKLQQRFGLQRMAVTNGESGAIGIDRSLSYLVDSYPVQQVDRIGAGDAFTAGVICGLLRNDFELGLKYGTAMSALHMTLNGDMFRLTEAEVQQLIDSGPANRPIR